MYEVQGALGITGIGISASFPCNIRDALRRHNYEEQTYLVLIVL